MKKILIVAAIALAFSACADQGGHDGATTIIPANDSASSTGTSIETGTGGATSRPSGDTTGTNTSGITGANGNYDSTSGRSGTSNGGGSTGSGNNGTSGTGKGVINSRDSLNSYSGNKDSTDPSNKSGAKKATSKKDSGRRE